MFREVDSIYHTIAVTKATREAILFLFGCSEVNSSLLITSELTNQSAKSTIHLCGIYLQRFIY